MIAAAERPGFCLLCGRSLAGHRSDAKFCPDRNCRQRWHRGSGPLVSKPCQCCGRDFTPRRSDARFCDECRSTGAPWKSRPYRLPGALKGPCCDRPLHSETPGGGPWFCDECGARVPPPFEAAT